MRLDARFLAVPGGSRPGAPRPADGRACGAGRHSPASRSPNSSSRWRPSSKTSSASCSASRPSSQTCARRHDALAPLYTVKRLFVQRRAAKKYPPEQAATFNTDGALRREVEALIGGELTELAFADPGRALDAGRGRARRRARNRGPLRRLGDAYAGRPARPQGRRAVQGPAQGRSASSRAGRDRSGRRRDHAQAAGVAPPRARRLRADRSRHRSHRRARSCQLLHLVPQPGQGHLLEGAAGEVRRVQEEPVRRRAGRLSARRENLRDESRASRGPHPRRARHRDHRQSDVRRHRPPHLQRLHEGLHLSEAGAGRHSAGRDPRAQGRAGAAVGLRNLFAADALESAQHPPAAAEARDRTESAGGGARARRVSRWRII